MLTRGALAFTHSIVAANAIVVGGADGRAILVVALRTRFEGIEHLRVEVDDLELRVQRTATSSGSITIRGCGTAVNIPLPLQFVHTTQVAVSNIG